MPIEKIETALITDGNGGSTSIQKGDWVVLKPVNPGISETEITFRMHQHLTSFLEGEGPWQISWIGQWPCGGINLYLDLPRGREPGASAHDFQLAKPPDNSTEIKT